MATNGLTSKEVAYALAKGGVGMVPVVGSVLSELMGLCDQSDRDAIEALRFTTDALKIQLKENKSMIDALSSVLYVAPDTCKDEMQLLVDAVESPESPPRQFTARLEDFAKRFSTIQEMAKDHESRIRNLEALAPPPVTQEALMVLLIELFGRHIVQSRLSTKGETVRVMLNPSSAEELQRFVRAKYIRLSSTGSMTNMGANNRCGDHVEERKRPYGMGNGFELQMLVGGSLPGSMPAVQQ